MHSQISTAVTHSSRSARSLLGVLPQSLQKRHSLSSPNSILLFALAASSETPPEVLSDITSTLTQLFPEHVGCLSAPLPYEYIGLRPPGGPHSCSLAYAFVNGVSFHSTILGREEPQVGRWHAARQRNHSKDGNGARANVEDLQIRIIDELSESDGQVKWEGVWDHAANLVASPKHEDCLDLGALPDELRCLDPSAIDNIIYFSHKTPKRLETALESRFLQANKLSLIASSTPFITGRPATLFHNGSILSTGAVGIAFNSSLSSPPPVVELSLPPLVALSDDLKVTSCEGNLILSLDLGNPTKLLLAAIRKHGLSSSHAWVGKDDQFYIGVVDPSGQQLYRITAGDPSRGSIALDAALAPREGSTVRLYHLPGSPNSPTYTPDTGSQRISLFVAPEMTLVKGSQSDIADDQAGDNDHLVIANAFLAASENGFTLSRSAQRPWKCVAPGARTGLSWR